MDPTLLLEAGTALQDVLAPIANAILELDPLNRVTEYRGP